MLYNDGAFEVERPDEKFWPHAEVVEFVAGLAGADDLADRLDEHARSLGRRAVLADVFSVLDVRL